MMTTTDDERAWLAKSLADLKGRKLSAIKDGRTRYRHQLHLGVEEKRALSTMRCALMLHLGRPVSLALTMRLALLGLSKDCMKSLKDPAMAARLKAELLAIRAEKAVA